MTSVPDMLAEAERVLREDLAPSLEGDARYLALLACKAIAISAREVALSAGLVAAEAAVSVDAAGIRGGAHDDDDALYRRLHAVSVLRAYIADPGALTDAERRNLLEAKRP